MTRRVLLVAPYAPAADGQSGGVRAVHGLVRELTRRHEVVLVHLDRFEIDPEVAERCAGVHPITVSDPGPWGVRSRGAVAVLRGRSLKAAASAVGELRRSVRAIATTFDPSVLQVETGVLGDVLGATRGPVRVVTVQDPAATWRESLGLRPGGASLAHRLDAQAALREERRVLVLADGVVAFTDRDRRLLQDAAPPTTHVVSIPLAADVPPVPLDPLGQPPPTLLYIGNFAHPPNVEAALRLALRIFPAIRVAHPDARLEIVGAAPPDEVRALVSAGVSVTGEVASVAPYLDRASIVVAPIGVGGGTRVKVLDALAAGKAVVATSRGIEGIAVRPGQEVIVADADDELIAAVTGLLTDAQGRQALATRARAWAERELSWSRMADRYDELYDKLEQRRGARA